VIQHAVDNLFHMMLSTEPLRLVCLNGNGIPVFKQSSNGGSVHACKSINDSVTRIGEHLDKTSHSINRLESIVDRMVARLEKDRWFGSKAEEGRKLGDQWKTTSLGDPNQMMR